MQKRRKSSETYIIGEFLMRQESGRTDLEQNFSADEREVYKCTPSEETEKE